MTFEPFLFSIIGLGIGLATISDLKTRIVPNWITYGLTTLGLILAVFTQPIHNVVFHIIGYIFCFIIAYILFVKKYWGGGDAKLLAAIGAGLGFTPNLGLFFISFLIGIQIYLGGLITYFLIFKKNKKLPKNFPLVPAFLIAWIIFLVMVR